MSSSLKRLRPQTVASLSSLSSLSVLSAPPPDGTPFIATHSGSFHCDEAFGTAMLKLLPEFQSMPVVRTRTPEFIAKAAIAIDVGGEYIPETRRFDHHQRTFTSVYDAEHGIKMSSAGLVFKHFGPDVIRAVVGSDAKPETIDVLVKKTYTGFVMELDAVDNGIEMFDGAAPKYRLHTDLSSRVGSLNPAWNEPSSHELENERFKEAVELVCGEFISTVNSYAYTWLPARDIVQSAIVNAKSVHPSGKIAKLESFCPWKSHLFDIEGEMGILGNTIYIIFQDSAGSWRVQGVPQEESSFGTRKPLPEAWRGLRDAELSAAVGFPGGIFIHAGGFIGGYATYEGALHLASQSLE